MLFPLAGLLVGVLLGLVLNVNVSFELARYSAVAILAALGWMALDFGVGVAMAIILVPTWYAAEAFCGALGGPSATWVAFGVLFVGGWVLQFLGHHYEGKRPALLDNIFQGFIGPMFLVAETMVALGYRADLADVMGEGEVRP